MTDDERYEFLNGVTPQEMREMVVWMSGYSPEAFASAVEFVGRRRAEAVAR